MKALKTPVQLFHQILDLYTIKNEQQRRDRAISSLIILVVLAIMFYFFS